MLKYFYSRCKISLKSSVILCNPESEVETKLVIFITRNVGTGDWGLETPSTSGNWILHNLTISIKRLRGKVFST